MIDPGTQPAQGEDREGLDLLDATETGIGFLDGALDLGMDDRVVGEGRERGVGEVCIQSSASIASTVCYRVGAVAAHQDRPQAGQLAVSS